MTSHNWVDQAKQNKCRAVSRKMNYFKVNGQSWSADVIYSWLAINADGSHILFQHKPFACPRSNTWINKGGHSINKQIAVYKRPMWWSKSLIAINE